MCELKASSVREQLVSEWDCEGGPAGFGLRGNKAPGQCYLLCCLDKQKLLPWSHMSSTDWALGHLGARTKPCAAMHVGDLLVAVSAVRMHPPWVHPVATFFFFFFSALG